MALRRPRGLISAATAGEREVIQGQSETLSPSLGTGQVGGPDGSMRELVGRTSGSNINPSGSPIEAGSCLTLFCKYATRSEQLTRAAQIQTLRQDR